MRYRLYQLDPHHGRIRIGKDLACDNDEDAIQIGIKAQPEGGFEIWDGERKVYPDHPQASVRGE